VSFKDDAIRALREGQNAEPDAVNPYSGESLLLAKVWMRGYMTMLTIRTNSGPAMQRYLAGRRRSCRFDVESVRTRRAGSGLGLAHFVCRRP
jgi:hypothetical protein